MVGIFIFFGVIILTLVICAFMIEKSENSHKNVVDYVITELYMDGKISVDAYLGYTLPSSEAAKKLKDKDRFKKYVTNQLYSENELPLRIDRDINKNN